MIKTELKAQNGITYTIRPIEPSDKIYLRQGLKEMSLESTRQRFQSGKSDFSDAELKWLTEVDQKNHMAFVACYEKDEKFHPAAVIRGVKSTTNPKFLEIAITVIDQHQHLGLGSKLLEVLFEWSKTENIEMFFGDLHNSNLKMRSLLEKFGSLHYGLKANHIGDGFMFFEIFLRVEKT
jgi:GNAT superfamily N-acetyltransferase